MNPFGNLLKETRTYRGISKVRLCRGLCSAAALVRYEKEERMPDKFLADALLQRLGLNPCRFEFIASNRDFFFSDLRSRLERLVNQKKAEEARKLLSLYKTKITERDILHRQYILLLEAILDGENGKYKEGIETLKEALSCTKCDIKYLDDREALLTDIELRIFYTMAKYLNYLERMDESHKLYENLKIYIDTLKWDNEKRKEYYPHILYRLSEHELRNLNYGKAGKYLDEAEKILVENYKIDNLYEILCMKNTKKDFMWALRIILESKDGKITENGKRIWENIINQQSSEIQEF
ncbi:MAG: hypothetical protein Q4C65_11820 [Eubacteriales bacterium]|nr:hypothetical protein [Eubacteriales bacterium]